LRELNVFEIIVVYMIVLFFVVWSFKGAALIDHFLDVYIDSKKIKGSLTHTPTNFDNNL